MKSLLKILWHILGLALVIGSIVFFTRYLIANIGKMPSLRWNADTCFILFSSLVIYLMHLGLAAYGWRVVLSVLGCDLAFMKGLSVFLISQFGKYIPGNIAHHLGRVGLSKKIGVPMRVVLPSLFIELSLLVVCSIILFALFTELDVMDHLQTPFAYLLLAILICTLPLVLPRCVTQFIRLLPPKWQQPVNRIHMTPLQVVIIMVIYPCVFLTLGGIINLIAVLEFGKDSFFLAVTGIFALSWLAGFLLPGAPAGIGIREAILLSLLEPLYGSGTALSLTILCRIIGSFGDLLGLLFGLVYYIIKIRKGQYPQNIELKNKLLL